MNLTKHMGVIVVEMKKFNLVLALGSDMVKKGESTEVVSNFLSTQGVNINKEVLSRFMKDSLSNKFEMNIQFANEC